MISRLKIFLAIAVITVFVIGINSCSRRTQTTDTGDTTKRYLTDPQSPDDSTEIYGRGYFDYRDSINSYHLGYSIPRDSIYKVENLKAFEQLNLLIKQDSLEPGPYLDRGNHFQNIHKYIDAILDYDKYIELNPYNYSGYLNRGTAHERLKHYDQALWDYTKVLELKPDDTISQFNKGVVYDAIGNHWQAIKEYDTTIIKDQHLAKAYYNRGASYEKVAKYDEAIRDYTKAMELNPKYKEELMKKIDYLNYEFR